MRGSIRKRGKWWTAVVYLGLEPHPDKPGALKPRQAWKGKFATKQEAQRWCNQTVGEVQNATYVKPTELTVGAFLQQWMTDYAAGTCVQTTLTQNYAKTVKHLTAEFGSLKLAKLTPMAIQGYYTKKRNAGLSPATIHMHSRLLRTALKCAVEWGLLSRNPALQAKPPKRERYRPVIWDQEQIKLFLAQAKRTSRYYPLYLTAVATGMRQGELLGLEWKRVDLAIGECQVRQSFYRIGSGATGELFKSPKNDSSVRTLTLPGPVVTALREVREAQQAEKVAFGPDYVDYDLVFCQEDGKPLHTSNLIRRDFHPVSAVAGLPRCRFHDLRHAHVSYLALAGVPIRVAMDRVGHRTVSTTLSIYSHTLAGQDADAARRIGEFLTGREQTVSKQPENGDGDAGNR